MCKTLIYLGAGIYRVVVICANYENYDIHLETGLHFLEGGILG